MADAMPVGNRSGYENEQFPFALFNEEQAQRNHGQSLKRLAERGGLSWCEAAAVIERRDWRKMDAAEAEMVVRKALAVASAPQEPDDALHFVTTISQMAIAGRSPQEIAKALCIAQEPVADDDAELAELKVFHGAECNRYTNGQCTTRRCLVRGGYTSGPPNYDTATCEAHEAILALDRLQAKAPETGEE